MTQEPGFFGKSIDGHPTCAIDAIFYFNFSLFLTQIYHVASKDFEYNTQVQPRLRDCGEISAK